MKAIVCTQYGPPEVLLLREVEKPVPKNNELLIKVFATAVTSGDCRCRGFTIPAQFSILTRLVMRLALGITRPRKPILGLMLAGEVDTVGRHVKRYKRGDQVFGDTGMRFGAYAEYTCLPENATITEKPANITYEEAAAVPFGGSTALYFLRKGKIRKGQNELIYGAFRGSRNLSGSACPVLWGRCHRGMQYHKPGTDEIPGSTYCH
jgi:NADPH:quinone reductase-like Zn-dependent oxidoreductase